MVNGVFSIPLGFTFGDSDVGDRQPATAVTALSEYIADDGNPLSAVNTELSELLQRRFSPLVLTGASGVGKSFLAQGLVARWSQEDPEREIVVCTGADFARALANAIDTDATEDFRRRFRTADILLVDDLTELARKEAAQIELARTLDHLHQQDRFAVVTSRVTPTRLSRFAPQLVSRLTQGLVLPLSPPGPAARREIVSRLADRFDVPLSDDSLTLLATSGPPSVSGLSGLVQRIKSHSHEHSQPLSTQFVHSCLDEQTEQEGPAISSIAKLVARRFRLKVADLKSPSRRQAIVRARGAAMYLSREYTELSLERIGKFFGKRDHTTVLHACRQAEDRLSSDPVFKEALIEITSQLSES